MKKERDRQESWEAMDRGFLWKGGQESSECSKWHHRVTVIRLEIRQRPESLSAEGCLDRRVTRSALQS